MNTHTLSMDLTHRYACIYTHTQNNNNLLRHRAAPSMQRHIIVKVQRPNANTEEGGRGDALAMGTDH